MESKTITFELPSNVDIKNVNLPKNYTLFINELKRFAFGDDDDDGSGIYRAGNYYHGMTPDEYDRFISDMWIGIVLTIIMVFIVFALCFWYTYHKFQQWKISCRCFFVK